MTNNFVQNVLFCDDVRTERNGKDIAVGIYNGYIVVPQIPFVINLAVRIEINLFGKVLSHAFAKFCDPNGNRLLEVSAPLDVMDWNLPFSIALPFVGLILPTIGDYKLFIKFDGEWELHRILTVQKIDTAKVTEQFELMARHMRQKLLTDHNDSKDAI